MVLIMNEIADARAATDEVMRAQASADISNKKMLEGLNAINKKVDNANLTLGDFASSKNKIACENSDLLRIVGDLDNNLNILAKQKAALSAQLNDVKALCDNEARERGLLLGKYRNLEHELDGARCALEEEAAGRENTLRLVAKAEAESQCWRQKYETDAVAKGEELEMTGKGTRTNKEPGSWHNLALISEGGQQQDSYSMVLTGLEEEAQYELRLRAMNRQGWSGLSEPFHFRTAGSYMDIKAPLSGRQLTSGSGRQLINFLFLLFVAHLQLLS